MDEESNADNSKGHPQGSEHHKLSDRENGESCNLPTTNNVEMVDESQPASSTEPNVNKDDNSERNIPETGECSGHAKNDKRKMTVTKKVEQKSVDKNEPGTSTRIKKPRKNYRRQNYRSFMELSSSSDSDDSSDSEPVAPTNHSNAGSRESTEFELPDDFLNSSSNNSDSVVYSSDYPFSLDAVFTDDSNSSTSRENANVQSEQPETPKPMYNWNQYHSIISREHGLFGRNLETFTRSQPIAFQNRFYGSRQAVEKMKFAHSLNEHEGCVNSLHFNKAGNLLVSGSDDLKIILWNWAANKIACQFSSGHTSNVFQTKFIDIPGAINIVTSARDGQVRHTTIPPSGARKPVSRILYKHFGAVHKIASSVNNPYEILTVGEDSNVVRCDIREKPIERVVTVKVRKRKVPLYSISHHPFDQQFCVCGRDHFVRVYDKRNTKKTVHLMCPSHLENKKALVSHITCAVYNATGTEIIASYSDDLIYLFKTKYYRSGQASHQYKGHNNNKTIKGVNFFGLNSEYVVSGSDCGSFFFWDKETETIVNWLKGDNTGVVNCLEPHPTFPILATSGLDHDVKIWMPSEDPYPRPMNGLMKCVRQNMKRTHMNDNDLFDDRTFFFFVRQCIRNRPSTADENCPYVQDLVTSSSEDEGNPYESADGNVSFRSLPCAPQ